MLHIERENVHFYGSINICIFKENQNVVNKFYISFVSRLTIWFPFPDFRFKNFQRKILPGSKVQTFGAKKNVSVPYFTVFGILMKILMRLYCKVLLILKTSLIIAGESP